MRIALLTSSDVAWPAQLARTWAGDGDRVTLVLLDGASAAARSGHADAAAVSAVADEGVAVLVHDGALRRRGITTTALAEGVRPVDLDVVADLVGDGADRVIWL